MTAQNFMNVVRFKLKSDCVDKYFEVIDKTCFEGMTQKYIAKTGDYDYCFVGIWKSAEAIAAQRPAMTAHLDEVRGFMEELSPELGVTDPVSRNKLVTSFLNSLNVQLKVEMMSVFIKKGANCP